jgi:hypothetical protein
LPFKCNLQRYIEADDVLWYAGNASSIAMIRKVPGLAPYSSDQVGL